MFLNPSFKTATSFANIATTAASTSKFICQERFQIIRNKLKLDIDFLNNCKQLGVYPKFLIFKLPNVSNKDTSSIPKRLLRSPINKRNKKLQHVLKELHISENLLSKQLSTNDFYVFKKSTISYNNKWLQKSLYT